MDSTTPQTSDQPAKVKRSFTLPTKLSDTRRPRDIDQIPRGDAAVEVLFAHPSGRIVSFSPPLASISSSASIGGTGQVDEVVGTLPWASRTERTMAVGPLRMYRVPSAGTTVSFLNSGKFLHPIMQKSQCWCVDGDTKFVIRIRGHNYYRIELPNSSEEDRNAADDLKRTLAEVLQYETTACPFKRGFYVELPEKVETTKKPWKPKHRPITATLDGMPQSSGDEESASQSDRENSAIIGEGLSTHNDLGKGKVEWDADSLNPDYSEQLPERIAPIISAFEDLKTPTAHYAPELPLIQPSYYPTSLGETVSFPDQPSGTDTLSSVAIDNVANGSHLTGSKPALDLLEVSASPIPSPLADSIHVPPSPGVSMKSTGKSESGDKNFGHSGPDVPHPRIYQSVTQEMTPELPDSLDIGTFPNKETDKDTGPASGSGKAIVHTQDAADSSSTEDNELPINVPRIRHHAPTLSQNTINANSPSSIASFKSLEPNQISPTQYPSDAGCRSSTSQLSSRSSSPSSTLRRNFSHRRSNSPLPPAANLYPSRDPNSRYNDLASAVIQRTANIVLTPPAFLVALMIKIARRIANGAIRGESSMNVMSGRRIPCSWDSDEQSSDDLSDEDIEDDYGISLNGGSSSNARRGIVTGARE